MFVERACRSTATRSSDENAAHNGHHASRRVFQAVNMWLAWPPNSVRLDKEGDLSERAFHNLVRSERPLFESTYLALSCDCGGVERTHQGAGNLLQTSPLIFSIVSQAR